MRCFSFSHSERRSSEKRRKRFSWGFLSQGSAPDSRKSSSSTKSRSQSEPGVQSIPNLVPESLVQSPSQRASDLRRFSYSELRAATKNFSHVNLVGEGGFGCVYRGFVKDRSSSGADALKEVAVKQLNLNGHQGHKEWLAEVHFLGLVEHPNLVKLVGYCAEDDARGIQRLLVYEYMTNRSLEDHLFLRGRSVLSWELRLQILLGAARGLAYLHEEIQDFQVIFRDFKSSNVLLDKDFTPKLSDFGLARQGPEVGATHVSTAVVGTLGYAAPEYIQTGHLTSKSDVWSFGVVLLEMIAGRRSLDRNRPKKDQQLLDLMKPYLQGTKKFHKIAGIMDPRLDKQYSLSQAEGIVSLAQQCLGKHAKVRPPMSTVVEKLKEIIESPTISSQHNDVVPSGMAGLNNEPNADGSKESESAKRRRLLFEEAINLKNMENAPNIMRRWGSKTVQV